MSEIPSLEVPSADTPGWWLSVYPGAGEAGGSLRRRAPGPVSAISRKAPDPQRSRAEAARRARGRLRRYCADNRLNRLGTLTYGPPFCLDPRQARADAGVFFRQLRSEFGAPFPYVWVPVWHADKERLHLHFAVGQFIHRSLIEKAWGHGFVHIKLLSDLPVGSGKREEGRKAAAYLSKYVSKSFEAPTLKGLHRFDVAQGFQPKKVTAYGLTKQDALAQASLLHDGHQPGHVWSSYEAEFWSAPPSVWALWAG